MFQVPDRFAVRPAYALLLITWLTPAAPAFAQMGGEYSFSSASIEPLDAIVALVEEDVILRSELDLAISLNAGAISAKNS